MRLLSADLPVAGCRERSRKARRAAAAMAGLAVTLLAAACSAAAGNTTSAHPPETAITVAAEPGIDDAPLYIEIGRAHV